MEQIKSRDEWQVFVNGVPAGTISESARLIITHRVWRDERLWIAQVMELFSVVARALGFALRTVPLVIFWALVATACIAPDAATDLLVALRSATPLEISLFLANIGTLPPMMALIFVTFAPIIGFRQLGFVNRFANASDEQIRRHCGIAATGDLVLQRVKFSGTAANA